jgi:tRNA G26 N,N-dimethylase Trm1
LEEKNNELSKELSFQTERADNAEQQLSLARLRNEELLKEKESYLQKITQLETELDQTKAAHSEHDCENATSETQTLDNLLEKLHNLGYEAYIKKIW